MNKETIDFYDRESTFYSDKRYPEITSNFTQYLFKTRRDIFLDMLWGVLKLGPTKPSVLEIGSADGILFKQMEERFPNQFGEMVGMDVSTKMIEVAKEKNKNPRVSFYLRDQLPKSSFDLVVELGVHPFDLRGEINYALEHINPGGYFFYSVVGESSLHTRFKMKQKLHTKDYLSHKGYEKVFRENFVIKKSKVYGFFVPKLWSVSIVGRITQPVIDWLLQLFSPELFHEKIYLLQNSTSGQSR